MRDIVNETKQLLKVDRITSVVDSLYVIPYTVLVVGLIFLGFTGVIGNKLDNLINSIGSINSLEEITLIMLIHFIVAVAIGLFHLGSYINCMSKSVVLLDITKQTCVEELSNYIKALIMRIVACMVQLIFLLYVTFNGFNIQVVRASSNILTILYILIVLTAGAILFIDIMLNTFLAASTSKLQSSIK